MVFACLLKVSICLKKVLDFRNELHVVKIIGKGTYAMIHRYRIPAFLKFDSVGFYFVLVQQIIDINR